MDKKTSYIGIKQQLPAVWDFFSEIILEPLLFVFVVVMLFSRIQAIINYIAAYPTSSFWRALELDMQFNQWLYITFLVVYGLWAISKGIKYRRGKLEEKQLNSTLEKISTNISDLQEGIKDLSGKIEDLPDKITESIKSSKNEDNESK